MKLLMYFLPRLDMGVLEDSESCSHLTCHLWKLWRNIRFSEVILVQTQRALLCLGFERLIGLISGFLRARDYHCCHGLVAVVTAPPPFLSESPALSLSLNMCLFHAVIIYVLVVRIPGSRNSVASLFKGKFSRLR